MKTVRTATLTLTLFACLATAGLVSARAEETRGTLNQSGSYAAPAPAVPKKGAAPDWRKETEATCGMACRYHRANDNLTLQALYLVTKIQKIDGAIKNNHETEARIALGAFCKDGGEDIDLCFDRYKAFQRVGLLELRQAIGKNEDTIARLTSGRNDDGTVSGTALAFDTGVEKTPYMPEVPTLSELEQAYLRGKLQPTGTKYSVSQIKKWSQDLIINNPNVRYLEFNRSPVVGNPYQDEKTSYSLVLEKRDSAGRPVGDARALKAYQESEKKIRPFAEDKGHKIMGEISAVGVTKNLAKDDKLTYDAITEARSVINSKIDQDMKRKDDETTSRKPASSPKPQPSPSPKPSSSPTGTSVNGAGDAAREVKVTTGSTATRAPTGMKIYGDEEKVERPAEMKNSRYIKYDLGDLMNDLETSTK